MFRFSYFLILTALPAAFNQLISFKDGKIGVNFAGYHAEAGLGGLLTGDAAHGGLSASAGTPFGQRAGAGLGGTVDNGQTRGGLYAGASAGYGVGASAALGGNVDEVGASGGSGAEAHARGLSTKTVKLSQTPQQPRAPHQSVQPLPAVDTRFADDEVPQAPSVVQQLPEETPAGRRYLKRKELRKNKVRAQEKVDEDSDEENYEVKTKTKSTSRHGTGATTYTATKQFQANPNFFNDIFNIPISTLGAVNQFLNNGAAAHSGGVTVTKTVAHSH